jgi:hypothetical protein
VKLSPRARRFRIISPWKLAALDMIEDPLMSSSFSARVKQVSGLPLAISVAEVAAMTSAVPFTASAA